MQLMLLGRRPSGGGLAGRRGGGSNHHCLFPVFVTLGLSLVRFASVAQNSGPFGGVVPGLRLSESGWAGGGRVLPPILPGSQGCFLAVGLSLGGWAVAGFYLLYCLGLRAAL